jgi:anti-sigma regulatory factor (Ser/Thr protein kinase)
MHLSREEMGGCALVRLAGDVVAADGPRLGDGLRKAFTSSPACVLCDLTELHEICPSCASIFVRVAQEQSWPGPTLILAGASGSVLALLHAQGVHRFVRMVGSIDDVVTSVDMRPPRLREVFLGDINPRAASRARHFAADACDRWGLGDVVYPLTLIVSELVTNAYRHAQTDFQMTLEWRRSWLTVGVRDWGAGLPSWPRVDDQALLEGGAGLGIVASMTDAHGCGPHPAGGNTVWAAIRTNVPAQTEDIPTAARIRAERTVCESVNGSWRQLLGLTWLRGQPHSVRIDLDADPAHPAILTGHWDISRDVLVQCLHGPVTTDRVRIGFGSADSLIIDLDSPVVRVDLPVEWLRAFLGRIENA